MYNKIIFILMAMFALMMIAGCPYKNEITGFFLIMGHHTYMTYKIIKNINKNGFLKFKNFEFLSYMMIFTALVKGTIGYTNGGVIVNDMMGIDINPTVARIGVLVIVVILIVLPMYFYDKKNKNNETI